MERNLKFEAMKLAIAIIGNREGSTGYNRTFDYEISTVKQLDEGWFMMENRYELDDFFKEQVSNSDEIYRDYSKKTQIAETKLNHLQPFWVRFKAPEIIQMEYTDKHKKMLQAFHDLKHGQMKDWQVGKFGTFELSSTEQKGVDWFPMENKQELINFLGSLFIANIQGEKRELLETTFKEAGIGDNQAYYLRFKQ